MIRMNNRVLVQVWDPLVRIGHWLIVAGFFVAYVLEDDKLQIHVWAGYIVGSVLLVRLLWGFVGTDNARFRSFIFKPQKVIRYLVDLPRGRSRRYLGHSPAGGAMIILLMLGLSVISVSGLMVYAYEESAGPMSIFIDEPGDHQSGSHHRAGSRHSSGKAARANHEDREEFWEELHEIAANLTLALVFLHVLGVLLAGRMHKENLIASMVSGKKYVGDQNPANAGTRDNN